MLTSDLGACEWFVWDLRRSNLIDRGQLDQMVTEFLSQNPGAEPPDLANILIEQGYLTEFQAERLLQGKTQGFVLGPFTLKDSLGIGSMGTVYRAQSKTDQKEYAVKVLPRRSMWNVRIARRKVRAFEQCQHPAVVPFVDVGTSGGMHYLAWPLVEGETLERIVQAEGAFTPELAVHYALAAANGMKVVHDQGLFHGLLKPSNLMLGPDGQVRILDFGIGSLLAETEGESLVDTMSTANSVNSGLDCASPESIMDPTNLTPIGDQYSLGCVLYFFLAGQYPFPDGTAVEKMMAHQTKQPTPLGELNPNVPAELLEIVERLMEKDPAKRYANTAEVIQVLQPFAEGGAGTKPRIARPASRPNIPAQEKSLPPLPTPVAPSASFEPVPRERDEASARLADLRRGGQQQAPQPPAAIPVPQGEYPPQDSQPQQQQGTSKKLSWDQRLGPVGIALIAVLAGTAAWFLSSLFN